MARSHKTGYVCQNCGVFMPRWAGQCPECKSWDAIVEAPPPVAHPSRPILAGGYAGQSSEVVALSAISSQPPQRVSCGSSEMDRVLGSGLVPGSVTLLGGEPGIGKSTLLLQLVVFLAQGMKFLYVAGEESREQIALRARRLGVHQAPISLFTESCVEQVLHVIQQQKPALVVLDSIQSAYSDQLPSAPGTVSQVRECAAMLVRCAKQQGITMLLIGHVTREGHIAGPKVLEHMVDTVLYFESDAGSRFRMVRAFKNRFGTINELAVFLMTEQGLKEITNPSALFLSRSEKNSSGSVIACIQEGTRALLLEVQALTDTANGSAGVRRLSMGIDSSRLMMLLAVLHRHGGVQTAGLDVFINVVGGMRVTETSTDLPMLLAVTSSLKNRPVDRSLAVFGEVGLSGEVRPVPNGELRLMEAAQHGFTRVIVPKGNAPRQGIEGMQLHVVTDLQEALTSADLA